MKESVTKHRITFYEAGHEEYEIRISNAQKNSYPYFVIENSGKEKRIAFKIKDVNKYINRFYIVSAHFSSFLTDQFLQNFGVEREERALETNSINYKHCVHMEERLDMKVDQMLLCMNNLFQVFTQGVLSRNKASWDPSDYIQKLDSSFQDGKLKRNQAWLTKNFIFQNLLELYHLIISLVFESLFGLKLCAGKQSMRKLASVLEKEDSILQTKLPQIFLKDYLDPLLENMYTLFYLLEYNNPSTSLLILSNFSNFYKPKIFYRFQVKRLLIEATSNSELMGKEVLKVIKTIFQDLKLPRLKGNRIKHQTFKMSLIKNLLKNLIENKRELSRKIFRFLLHSWRKKIENVYQFRFEYNSGDSTQPALHFLIAQDRVTSSEKRGLDEKISTFRQEFRSYFKKAISSTSEEGQFQNFAIKTQKLGSKKYKYFSRFLEKYIVIKSMFYHVAEDLKVELKDISEMEKEADRGAMLKLLLDKKVRWEIRKAISNFVCHVYLDVEKYNFITDEHDFTFFLQKM